MGRGTSRVRLACATVVLVGLTGCSGQPAAETAPPVIPPAQPAAPATGPGTYLGQAVNGIGAPIPVRVTIGPDTSMPPSPDAAAVGAYLRAAAAELSASVPTVRYVDVGIDNTGEIDAVPLPGNVDVLDVDGQGANFRPAYDVVRENQQLLPADSALSQQGAVLAQQLVVRDNLVRPGQVAAVPYVSNDQLAGVDQVVVDGELARKDDA